MMESAAPFLTGQFLLALPGIGDPRFEHAVIAMCGHDMEGAIGIGIGATIGGLGLHDVLDQFDIEPGEAPDAPVHFGGPVEPRRGFVLHSTDWAGQDTIEVAGRWALSGTIDILKAIADGQGPSRWLVALGYAGWGRGSSMVRCCAMAGSISPATSGCCSIPRRTTAGRKGSNAPGSIRACSPARRARPDTRPLLASALGDRRDNV